MRHAIIVKTGARMTRPHAERMISKPRLRKRAAIGRPTALAASTAPLCACCSTPTTTFGPLCISFFRLSTVEPVELHFLAVQRGRTDHEMSGSAHHDTCALIHCDRIAGTDRAKSGRCDFAIKGAAPDNDNHTLQRVGPRGVRAWLIGALRPCARSILCTPEVRTAASNAALAIERNKSPGHHALLLGELRKVMIEGRIADFRTGHFEVLHKQDQAAEPLANTLRQIARGDAI